MIITARNAEETLIHHINQRYEDAGAMRCLYMRLSETDFMNEHFFAHFAAALEKIAAGQPAHVYICHDRDIFILMQGLSQKSVYEFAALLESSARIEHIEPRCSLYEVRVDGATIKNICARKLEKLSVIKTKKALQEEHELQCKEREKTLANLDATLVETISKRRNNRAHPEIMIVEDDALSRMLIKNVLGTDFSLSVLQDAESAILEYLIKAPDIVFLDIGLPDINGHDVLQKLIQIDPESYVIMFSGYKDKENILKAMDNGAMGFVGKPFTRGKLYQYIEQCPTVQYKLEKRRAEKTTG